ncbi:MAG: helix-turn-helix domain-containing protein [Leucobacter sp.]
MVARTSLRRQKQLRDLGANIQRWRKLKGVTAKALAAQAYVTPETLRHIERGTGRASMDSLMSVLGALGIANTVVAACDPWNSAAGRALFDENSGVVR